MMKIEVAKIVGAVNERSWSQVHAFEPLGEKRASHGQLIAALAFEAKKELEVASFGTEIITRLQETYYSNESASILKKISQTMETLAAEFLEAVSLEIVMAVIWCSGEETFLYVGRSGKGQAFLKRGESMVALLSEDKPGLEVVSGKLGKNDRLILGTAQFCQIVPEGVIKPALDQERTELMVESLAPLVHGHEEKSRSAAAIVLVEKEKKPQELKPEPGPDSPPEREKMAELKEKRTKPLRALFSRLVELAKGGLIKLKALIKFKPGAVYVRSSRLAGLRGGSRSRRSAATVALILILVFGLSLVLAGRKKQAGKREETYQQVMTEAGYRYDEAKSLLDLNPLRAKSLLKEAKDIVAGYKSENKVKLSDDLTSLEKEIDEALSQVQREYQVNEASDWYSFSLVKEGFKGTGWDSEAEEAVVWDEALASLVRLNLSSKAAETVISGEELEGGKWVGLTGKRAFVVSDNKLSVVDTGKGAVISEQAGDWNKVKAVKGFSSNLYVLDGVQAGQIWKYEGVEAGLSSQKAYLKGESFDLSEAVDMAIDGSVWVLFKDGSIVKYTRGVKDVFVIAGLDQALEEPIKLFTNPETEYLYILDRRATRVVVIAKNGEYRAEYVWPGIAGVKDLIVSEDLGKIFLLTGDKVFTIELKS
jgi:hypothetical protein